MRDLAPKIYRQRLIIEGFPSFVITDKHIEQYLQELCDKIDMTQLGYPITHKSDKYGWAGWMHWETSGVHFYAWEQPILFFSVDIYTCKKFDNQVAVDYTREFFGAKEIEFKEV